MKKNSKKPILKQGVSNVFFHKRFKPLLWTIITSLCVGVFLGYFVLKMVTEDYSATEHTVAMNQQDENKTKSKIELPGFSLFVLQGGVFAKAENATSFKKQIKKSELNAGIREEDNNQYVWLFVAKNDTTAKQQKKKVETQEVDTILKKWDIPESTVMLTEVESKWLQLFIDTLSEAVQSENIDKPKLQQLVNQDNPIPSFTSWYEELQTIVLQEDVTSEQLMLELLIHYEKFIKESKT